MVLPKCVNKRDCFANKAGKCTCLKNNRFDRPCPFYKKDPDGYLKNKIVLDMNRYLAMELESKESGPEPEHVKE